MGHFDFSKTVLGIEFGSTRIKAILIDTAHRPIASGSHTWESRHDGIYWTYSLNEIWSGLQDAYAQLAEDIFRKFGSKPETLGGIGISAMMHGYLPFARDGELLTPLRTWQNTTTGTAAAQLTDLFSFSIPQRWSVAHLYQAILNGEKHLERIDFLTTLAGDVHWQLTGQRVLGIGDASGMFPIDCKTGDYDVGMLHKFDALVAEKRYPWHLRGLLPEVLMAGVNAGTLSARGAGLLDPTGTLQPGIPLCPPEGDAGTGMVATNAVSARTCNVSAGTSIFTTVVLEHALENVYPEIDVVTTPDGQPVAMVHCNNCTSDFNAWAKILRETAALFGAEPDTSELFTKLYEKSLEGDPDCGGILVYNYLAGEPVTGLETGRPMVLRRADSRFTLSNFIRSQLYSALATLKIGIDILANEHIGIDRLMGHGGFFKTPLVGQKYLAAAVEAPVSIMKTAGEGGPYGIALLASYMLHGQIGQSLADYLKSDVFRGTVCFTVSPEDSDVTGFRAFLANYKEGLAVEKAASAI